MGRLLIKRMLAIVTCILANGYSFAQEIPLGTWRMHNSYTAIHSVALSPDKVYGAAPNGVVVVNRADISLGSITKLDGLSGADISAIAFDQPRNQLLVSYTDGMLDIIRTNEIVQFASLKNSPTISGSRRINQIIIRQGLAYLSADYGVVVFDLSQLQVKETWRDLGPAGQALRILECTFLNDSVFLATENGVMAGDMDDNLLDFARWKRFDQDAFDAPVKSVAAFNGKVYAAIDGAGLYTYQSGSWSLENFAGSDFGRLTPGANLLIVENNNLWRLNASGDLTQTEDFQWDNPLSAVEDAAGKLWIADARQGLVSDVSGGFESYIPNGPGFPGSFRLVSNNSQVYAVSGGYTDSFEPAGKQEAVNVLVSGWWNVNAVLLTTDVTDVDFSGEKMYVSTFGNGLQVSENSSSVTYTNGNSTLVNNQVIAIARSNDGLWVAEYGSTQPLHLLKNDNTWESFSFPVSASMYPLEIMVDRLDQVWMMLNPSQGGGLLVFSREKNQHVYLTDISGAGGLPSRTVLSLASDRDGQVWMGTSQGVGYFPNPAQVFTTNVNALRPIFEGRFLLRDEAVTAIAIDGGNRKWMGTQRGLWLFDPFGETQVHNFNVSNSPLLSDRIVTMAIQPATGEVFIGTDKGIASYRADATESSSSFRKVKIFPNPVVAEFSGVVSISGLATDATVKVMDISGKLIWQTYANGGTATWNVRDYAGRRAATGMYLVIAVAQDGSDSIVGKIAVIN